MGLNRQQFRGPSVNLLKGQTLFDLFATFLVTSLQSDRSVSAPLGIGPASLEKLLLPEQFVSLLCSLPVSLLSFICNHLETEEEIKNIRTCLLPA